MAERTILVCDVCGAPAQESVAMRVGMKGYVKDLCGPHLAELLSGTRAPRRGRRPGQAVKKAASSATPRSRSRSAGSKRAGRRAGTAKAADTA